MSKTNKRNTLSRLFGVGQTIDQAAYCLTELKNGELISTDPTKAYQDRKNVTLLRDLFQVVEGVSNLLLAAIRAITLPIRTLFNLSLNRHSLENPHLSVLQIVGLDLVETSCRALRGLALIAFSPLTLIFTPFRYLGSVGHNSTSKRHGTDPVEIEHRTDEKLLLGQNKSHGNLNKKVGVSIRGLNDKVTILHVPLNETVKDIKDRYCKVTGVEPERQTMLHLGKKLEDDAELNTFYDARLYTVYHMLIKHSPEQKSSPNIQSDKPVALRQNGPSQVICSEKDKKTPIMERPKATLRKDEHETESGAQIFITEANQQTTTLRVPINGTGKDIMRAYYTQTGVKPELQRLLLGAKQLADDDKIGNLHHTTFRMVLRSDKEHTRQTQYLDRISEVCNSIECDYKQQFKEAVKANGGYLEPATEVLKRRLIQLVSNSDKEAYPHKLIAPYCLYVLFCLKNRFVFEQAHLEQMQGLIAMCENYEYAMFVHRVSIVAQSDFSRLPADIVRYLMQTISPLVGEWDIRVHTESILKVKKMRDSRDQELPNRADPTPAPRVG